MGVGQNERRRRNEIRNGATRSSEAIRTKRYCNGQIILFFGMEQIATRAMHHNHRLQASFPNNSEALEGLENFHLWEPTGFSRHDRHGSSPHSPFLFWG